MRSIDIHAHLMPHCMLQALYRGENWHGVSGERNAQGRLVYGLGERRQALSPQFAGRQGNLLVCRTRCDDLQVLASKRSISAGPGLKTAPPVMNLQGSA